MTLMWHYLKNDKSRKARNEKAQWYGMCRDKHANTIGRFTVIADRLFGVKDSKHKHEVHTTPDVYAT